MNYYGAYPTYSAYNYRSGGIIGWIKTQHFRKALSVASHYDKDVAIDFGCADGYLLPELARRFQCVAGIEKRDDFRSECPRLHNLQLFKDLSDIEPFAESTDVIFALETLEHIHQKEWIALLRRFRALLKPNGVVITSVPIMGGLTFLVQRFGLWLTRSHREEMTWREIADSFLGRANLLEWIGGHVGFDRYLLEHAIRAAGFRFKRRRILFQYVYEMTR